MTTSDTWARVRALFEAALTRPPETREAFVRREADDEAVAEQVLALLGGHEEEGKLDALDAALRVRVDEAPTQNAPDPERVGPYRILELLGEGGMGRVYLAERDDGQFEHRVALKLMRAGPSAAALRPRFLAERQILAQLVHPNIAWLLDGNVTGDGRPYFVMEYVEGQPLTDFCDARSADVPTRMRLFLEVCDAVSYAHQRLVVHRDLKPGNVLVSGDGRVKLLDFGIAKLLTDESVVPGLTQGVPAPLTPEYAAPEQLAGTPVTLATDVYQLGVLLYELLTGRRPHEGDPDGERGAVLTREPKRPSAVLGTEPDAGHALETARNRGATTRRLTRTLSGDLDHIVLKALRREPEQRFRSVDDLADDVRRYLEGRPVHARRGTLRYRASRFVRRNRLAVAAGTAAVLALVAGAVGTGMAAAVARDRAAQAEAARADAEREAEHALEVTDFMVDLFEVGSDLGVRTDTLRLLPVLEAGVARLEDSTSLAPESRQRLLRSLSKVYGHLGQLDRSEAISAEAVRLARDSLPDQPRLLADALVGHGSLFFERGQIQEVLPYLTEAVELYDAEVAAHPADTALADETASTRLSLAVTQWRAGNSDLADSLAAQSVAYFAARGDEQEEIRALEVQAAVRADRRDDEGSLELRRQALEIRKRIHPPGHSHIASATNNVATTLVFMGRNDEALPLHLEALRLRRALFGERHQDVAASLNNVAATYAELGDHDQAVRFYEESLAMRRDLLGPMSGEVAFTLSAYARFLSEKMDRCDQALPMFEEAVPIWEAALGTEHIAASQTRGHVGDCLARLGQYEEAERVLTQTEARYVALLGPENGGTRRVRGYLADLYERWDRPEEAARWRAAAAER